MSTQNTVERHYNAVEYNIMLHALLQWSMRNINEFKYTKGTPYLALTGELWGVFCEESGENWGCYNRTVLYMEIYCVDINLDCRV